MVFENIPSDHETWSLWCHVRINVDFTSILHSPTPLIPQAYCEGGELGPPAPPFPPMRVLEVNWSWALSLVCDVALSVKQLSARFLGITGWDPCVCKSNRLHVDILWFSCTKFGYILQIPLKWSVNFLQSWTSTGYFSNSTGSFVTNCRFSPIIGVKCQAIHRDLSTLTFIKIRPTNARLVGREWLSFLYWVLCSKLTN